MKFQVFPINLCNQDALLDKLRYRVLLDDVPEIFKIQGWFWSMSGPIGVSGPEFVHQNINIINSCVAIGCKSGYGTYKATENPEASVLTTDLGALMDFFA